MTDENRLIRKGIWIYVLLLIFEGALRKWVLPGLSMPLLLVRDPIAIWILFIVWQRGDFPKSIYLNVGIAIGAIGILTALIFGHGNLFVAIYGARILLIHFPLLFIIGQILNRDDVIELGKLVLWLAVPITVLTALQFYSPQSSWVNRGVGGDISGSGFSGAMGFFRPSGTFSFTNGNSFFFTLVAVFVIYFWINQEKINRILLVLSSLAVVMAIPLSISRTLFFSIVISVFFAVFAASRNSRHVGKIISAGLVMVFAVLLLSQLEVFQTAIEVLSTRFDNAKTSEGGLSGTIIDRYLGGLLGAIGNVSEQPFFGHGMGMGTNAGSALLTGGRQFLISEDEWGRLIGELGPILGLGIILSRLGLCLELFRLSYSKMTSNDMLPWMLLSFGLLIIPQGQWAQPTTLGFSTVVGGLIIAALKESKDLEEEMEDEKE
jgi:hypothetical protein